jgi:glycosyltransferase involved in cell wall biosynthesis
VIYSHADIYVFPSFTESFGHSLVEAMAAGLPVIAADMPVNREVCGDAGAYFGIYDPEDCASKIEETLIEPDRKKELASHSILRSSKFSWQQYTGQIVQIFREAYLP